MRKSRSTSRSSLPSSAPPDLPISEASRHLISDGLIVQSSSSNKPFFVPSRYFKKYSCPFDDEVIKFARQMKRLRGKFSGASGVFDRKLQRFVFETLCSDRTAASRVERQAHCNRRNDDSAEFRLRLRAVPWSLARRAESAIDRVIRKVEIVNRGDETIAGFGFDLDHGDRSRQHPTRNLIAEVGQLNFNHAAAHVEHRQSRIDRLAAVAVLELEIPFRLAINGKSVKRLA